MKRLRVLDLVGLAGVASWARRLAFDSADPVEAAELTVALTRGGRVVARIICADEVIRYSAEMICESVLIQRQFTAEYAAEAEQRAADEARWKADDLADADMEDTRRRIATAFAEA